MMIHSVGDSHARCSFAGIPEVITHEIGPVTMESVGKIRSGFSSSAILDSIIENQDITKEDTVILCFGEIDVRSKIQPRVDAGERENDIITEIVDDYILTIQESQYYRNIWVLSITPPVSSTEQWNNPGFPFLGTDEARSRYTKKMNKLLRIECKLADIPLLDVYDNYKDEKDMLVSSLSDGSVHIGDTSFVKDALLSRR
jgi:hypothetical protein